MRRDLQAARTPPRKAGFFLPGVVMAMLLSTAFAQEVNLASGKLEGIAMDDGGTAFYGIPYAAAPVGKLRWREPQPVKHWTGVRQARAFAPACAQTAPWLKEAQSEDCLYLNVWAPAQPKDLPVIVWIHGGGFFGGSGSQPEFDGANLARHGAIVVTLNYRLGILGFFAHPDLTAESPVHAAGNQGILDQVAALRWVKNNIAAFGGDPQRVMIVGESAGGASVEVLVASPLARGLFQRAVSQSGTGGLPLGPEEKKNYDKRTAEAKGKAYAKRAGAASLAALRRLSVAELHRIAWSPSTTIDGYAVHDDLGSTYRRRRQNDVPLLVGWNAEEGKDLAPEILATDVFTVGGHRAKAAQLLGHAPSDALLAAYPAASDEQARASIFQLTNDWWGWRLTRWAALQAQFGRARPYVYFFAHRPAEPLNPCTYGCGAGHAAEIRYVFDNLARDRRPWSAEDRKLADQMAQAWVNFARTGDPNGSGLPAWPAYNGTNATVLRIGTQAGLPDLSLFRRSD